MPQQLPPDEEEARRQWQDQKMHEYGVDIQRLWKRLDSLPQDYIGVLPHGTDAFNTTTTTMP